MKVSGEIIKIELISNDGGYKRYLVDVFLKFDIDNIEQRSINNSAEFTVTAENINHVFDLAKNKDLDIKEFLKYVEK
jgi:hypothetical protein